MPASCIAMTRDRLDHHERYYQPKTSADTAAVKLTCPHAFLRALYALGAVTAQCEFDICKSSILHLRTTPGGQLNANIPKMIAIFKASAQPLGTWPR